MWRSIFTLLVVMFVPGICAAMLYDDGGTHVVDFNLDQSVEVRPGPAGATTTFILEDGGRIIGINAENSDIQLYGGEVYLGGVDIAVSSSLFMSDGIVNYTMHLSDCSSAEITGGRIGDLSVSGTCNAEMSGGRIEGPVNTSNDATFDIFGGVIFGLVTASHNSVVTIHGSNFQIGGVDVPMGVIPYYPSGPQRITGTLLSGDSFDNDLSHNGGIFMLIPEPGTALLLGVGLMGLAARRKN